MITAEEAKRYIKEFVPCEEILNNVESQIKKGERHVRMYTTRWSRDYAEDCAKYFVGLGYRNARIEDIYNLRTGVRGGNYLAIDL